jgi:hypothetical protein
LAARRTRATSVSRSARNAGLFSPNSARPTPGRCVRSAPRP